MANRSLRLEDFSDRELLFAFERASDDDGYATSQEVADGLGITVDNPKQSIAIRFGYMRRYGVMDREADEKTGQSRWFLTERGEALMRGALKRNAQRAFAELSEEEMYALTQQLTQQYTGVGPVAATLMGRQFRHGMARRKMIARQG